jgi:hypothetical protein
LAELANAIPRSSYLFGVSWPDVRRTLLVAVEQNGDPYAVMIPTLEVIRFYYAPSTRLAQALFWGNTMRRSAPGVAACSNDVWGYQNSIETRTVDTHTRRLREKLGRHALRLETVRGEGYRFNAILSP